MEKQHFPSGHSFAQGQDTKVPAYPGRAMMPPNFQLQAGAAHLELSDTVGMGGANKLEDLQAIARHLRRLGAPERIIQNLGLPSVRDRFIQKYQAEILGFQRPDGRIDPGGKTLQALDEARGLERVATWFFPEKQSPKSKPKVVSSKGGEIAPLLSPSQWFSQFGDGTRPVPYSFLKKHMSPKKSEQAYRNVACYQTCNYMLQQAGFQDEGKGEALYTLAVEAHGQGAGFEKEVVGNAAEAGAAYSRLDALLEQGIPVMIGVNKDTKAKARTNTHREGGVSPTDHYILIVGRIVKNGKLGYLYFDPGRKQEAAGASPDNFLEAGGSYLDGQVDGSFFGDHAYGKHNYVISEVRSISSL